MAENDSSDYYQFSLTPEFEGWSQSQLPVRALWDGVTRKTRCHGLPRLNPTQARGSAKRYSWAVVTVLVTGGMLWHLYTTFNDFFSYPVLVKLDLRASRQLMFPAVTVCNMNPLKRSALAASSPQLANLLLNQDTTTQTKKKKKKRKKRSLDITCASLAQVHNPSGLCFGLHSTTLVGFVDMGATPGARTLCQNAGGGLAMLHTLSKWEFVRDSTIFDGESEQRYWMNLQFERWASSIFLPATSPFTKWATGEPGDSCGVGDRSAAHLWYGVDCWNFLPSHLALCQQMVQCPWPVYVDTNGDNICYFFWDPAIPIQGFDTALHACVSHDQDATLAVIDTQAKFDHVLSTGVFDTTSEDTYWLYMKSNSWMETTTPVWTNWHPSVGAKSACTMAYISTGHLWDIENCNNGRGLAFCEWRETTSISYVPGNTTYTLTTAGVDDTTIPETTEQPSTQAETTIAETTLTATTVAETTLAATTLAETTLAATTAAETTLAATTAAETTLPATTAAETTLAATTVAETTLAATTVAEATLAATTVAETTLPATTVADKTLAATTVAETTLAATTLAETTLAATTVAETTVAATTLAETTLVATTVAETTRVATTVAETRFTATTVEETTLAATTVAETTLRATTVAEPTLAATTFGETTLAATTVAETTLRITSVTPTAADPTTNIVSSNKGTSNFSTTTATTTQSPEPSTTTTSTTTTAPVPPTTTPPPGATAPPAQKIEGSKYEERIQVREEFQKEEEAIQILADLPEEEKSSMGYSASEFILDCQYNGYLCSPSDFTQFYNGLHGNCFSFNSGWNSSIPREKSEKSGHRYGLKIIVNIEQAEYTDQFGEEAGARVVLHPADRMPFPEDEGVLAKPGKLTSIGVKKLRVHRLPYPHGTCALYNPDDKNLTKNVYEELYPVRYSRNACQKTCYQYYVISECGCSDPYFASSGEAFPPVAAACDVTNITQDDCKYDVNLRFMANKLDCSCPSSCYEEYYVPSVSTAEWPSQAHAALVESSMKTRLPHLFGGADPDLYKRNLMKVEIFYGEFNEEIVEERPAYNNFQFFSNVGGVMGLWMGLSIVTTLEAFEFILDFFVLMCFYRKCRPPLPRREVAPSSAESSRRESNQVSLSDVDMSVQDRSRLMQLSTGIHAQVTSPHDVSNDEQPPVPELDRKASSAASYDSGISENIEFSTTDPYPEYYACVPAAKGRQVSVTHARTEHNMTPVEESNL